MSQHGPKPPLYSQVRQADTFWGSLKRNWGYWVIIFGMIAVGYTWGVRFDPKQAEAVAKMVESDHGRLDAIETDSGVLKFRMEAAEENVKIQRDENFREHLETNLWMRQLSAGRPIPFATETPIPFRTPPPTPIWTVPETKPTPR